MKVDNRLVKKAAAKNKREEAIKKLPDLKNISIPTMDDIRNFDPSSIDKKKAITAGVIFLILIILLRGCAGMKDVQTGQGADVSSSVGAEAPAFGTMTADDIMTGKIERPYTGKSAKNIDLDRLVLILNDVMFIENREPFPETSSKGTYFTLYMEDGTKIKITAADNYLTINDVGWSVDAQSYNSLVDFATQALKR